jgi:hypothetical protein
VHSRWRSQLTLILALLLLDASVTFRNLWPTPAVRWTGDLSVELAVCLLGLAVVHHWRRPPSRLVLRLLSVIWLLFILGRYVTVTAPALWGRELNFYWDLQFLPDVAAMLAKAAHTWLVVAAVAVIVLTVGTLYAVIRWAFGRISSALAIPPQRRILTIVAAVLVVVFTGQRLVPAAPQVPTFSTPVTASYMRQVRFVIDATSGAHTLAASPSFASDLSRLNGADVLLFFIESYGAVTYERPEFSNALTAKRAALDTAIHESGHEVVSAYVESPTFGGSSWFAHITLLSGLDVRDPDTNALLMTEHRDTLPLALGRHGYRTVAMMPGLWYPWPEGAFYGFSEIYNGERLGYQGPPFGWWAMPDQFTLAKLDSLEGPRTARPPLFVFFPTVSTHTPFSPIAPYQPDWARMLTDHPYEDADLERAYDEEIDWMNLGPSYANAVNYAYETLAGYLRRHQDEDFVMIVLGDHQPPALVSGEGAPWDVPVHIITNRTAILDRLKARGFRAGLTPARPSLGRMNTLLPLLLDAFGEPEK